MTEAIRRYKRIIQSILKRETHKKRSHRPHVIEHPNPHYRDNDFFAGFLDDLFVNLKQPCEDEPKSNMIESCKQHTYTKHNRTQYKKKKSKQKNK